MKITLILYLFPGIAVSIFIMFTSIATTNKAVYDQPDIHLILESSNYLSPAFYNIQKKDYLIFFILIVWGLGILLSLFHNLKINWIFYRSIINNSEQIHDKKILLIRDNLLCELKINKKIEILLCNSQIRSPLLISVFRPIIIISPDSFSDEELYLILKHELTHYKHNDILLKRLFLLIQMLHWYNPFITIFTRKFFETSELVCDHTVLQHASNQTRILYSRLILRMIKNSISTKNLLVSSFVRPEAKEEVERRISTIMQQGKKVKTLGIIIATLIYCSIYPISVYAATSSSLIFQEEYVKSNATSVSTKQRTIPLEEYSVPLSRHNAATEIQLRDLNHLDYTLGSEKSIRFEVVAQSSDLRISILGDSSSDKFEVGLGDGNTINYVSATNGIASHCFSVKTGNTYNIYINNTSGKKIHISGEIYV